VDAFQSVTRTLRRPSFSGPQPAAIFISCRSHLSRSAPPIFHQLLSFNIDSDVSMKSHIMKTVSTCCSVLCQFWTIRRSLSRSVLQSLVSSLVFSWFDYGNASFAGVSFYFLSVTAAVSDERRHSAHLFLVKVPAHPLLRQLHWLKAPERIALKLAVLVYKCLHGSAPVYLTDELCQVADVEACQRLRSSSSSSLIVSRIRLTTVGDRVTVATARVCNSLPDLVTFTPSVAVFRSRLKTHLFNISYPCDCTVTAQ